LIDYLKSYFQKFKACLNFAGIAFLSILQ